MTERTIVLDDDDAALLDRLVAAGGYQDAAEAVHESLKLAALHAAIQVGVDDIAAGRSITLDTPEALSAFLTDLLAEPLDPRRE